MRSPSSIDIHYIIALRIFPSMQAISSPPTESKRDTCTRVASLASPLRPYTVFEFFWLLFSLILCKLFFICMCTRSLILRGIALAKSYSLLQFSAYAQRLKLKQFYKSPELDKVSSCVIFCLLFVLCLQWQSCNYKICTIKSFGCSKLLL